MRKKWTFAGFGLLLVAIPFIYQNCSRFLPNAGDMFNSSSEQLSLRERQIIAAESIRLGLPPEQFIDSTTIKMDDYHIRTDQLQVIEGKLSLIQGYTSGAVGIQANIGGRGWGGVVPLEFAFNVPREVREDFERACDQWAIQCICATNQKDKIVVYKNTDSRVGGFSSSIGKKGGSQTVHYSGPRSIRHELGHAFGLLHEHQRQDRDSYVRVNKEFFTGAFSDAAKIEGNKAGTFDFDSVMLYGCPGIEPLPSSGKSCADIGSTERPTGTDVTAGGRGGRGPSNLALCMGDSSLPTPANLEGVRFQVVGSKIVNAPSGAGTNSLPGYPAVVGPLEVAGEYAVVYTIKNIGDSTFPTRINFGVVNSPIGAEVNPNMESVGSLDPGAERTVSQKFKTPPMSGAFDLFATIVDSAGFKVKQDPHRIAVLVGNASPISGVRDYEATVVIPQGVRNLGAAESSFSVSVEVINSGRKSFDVGTALYYYFLNSETGQVISGEQPGSEVSLANMQASEIRKFEIRVDLTRSQNARSFTIVFYVNRNGTHISSDPFGTPVAYTNAAGTEPGSPTTAEPPANVPQICDALTQPTVDGNWGVKNGRCIQSCGVLGGTNSFADACMNHGMTEVGISWDVPFCCRPRNGELPPPPPPPTTCDPIQQLFPEWNVKNGICYKSCGALGGTASFPDACMNHGMTEVGISWDVPFCCRPRDVAPPPPPPVGICNPTTQPSPTWGVKNNQCLKSCGALGGTAAYADACSNHGMADVGVAYDVPFCCRAMAAATPPPQTGICSASQPPPDWGVKNNQCYKSCGALGGTAAFADACSNHGMADVGISWDVPFCCRAMAAATPPPVAGICSAAQPPPDWGVKNNQCLKSCGALGGTAAFADACSNHGLTDVGTAYDVPFCCR